jgi:hypothetical protein
MNLKPRIFISSPVDGSLTPTQRTIKAAIIRKLIAVGFEPQEFYTSGLSLREAWNFENVEQIMRRCQGAIVFAFEKWQATSPHNLVTILPTEYNHYEGALALALDKETLIIKEHAVESSGIAYNGGGHPILPLPLNVKPSWVNSNTFKGQFNDWVRSVQSRPHVFFGYSSKATDPAKRIIQYLNSIGVKVRDWQIDFRPAGTILDEIEESAKKALAGIFLFAKDDDLLIGDEVNAAPRDNVVFEAGYFMHAVGKERTLIIREKDAKMPADIGGAIYLELKNRKNTASIQKPLRKFISDWI